MNIKGDPEVIAVISDGGSYDWDTVEVGLFNNELYVRDGSGCSCNDIEQIDWEPLRTWEQLREALGERGSAAERVEFYADVNKVWLEIAKSKTVKS